MNHRTLSAILGALLAICVAVGLLAPATAEAAQAHLVSCNSTSSAATGRIVYVGVYQYAGQQIGPYYFQSYCPYSIEVY